MTLQTLLNQAVSLHRDGRLAEAEGLYRRVLAQTPPNFQLQHRLALLQFQQQRFAEALTSATAALALNPQAVETLTLKGAALAATGRQDEALSLFDTALALKPDARDALYHRAMALLRLGRPQEAVAGFDRLLALAPDHVDAWVNRGVALQQWGKFAEALDSYDRAVALVPGHVQAQINRGTAQQAQGRFADSLTSFDKALALAPRQASAWLGRASALMGLQRFEEALESFDAVLEITPGEPTACHKRDVLLETMKLLQDIPPDANALEVWQDRGALFQITQRFPEALMALDKVLALDPVNSTALVRKGAVLCEARRVAEGMEVYRHHADVTLAGKPVTSESDPPHKQRHDAEQRVYLAGRGVNDDGFRLEQGARIAGPAVNPANAGDIAARWIQTDPPVVVIDNLVTDEALEGLRRFCWGSTIWRRPYKSGYLGAMPETGFACPLLAQIADELRDVFPSVIGDHGLRRTWGFKYDSSLSGIPMHADQAAVNVNFWISPDDANKDPDSGGLVVWDVKAPRDWDFARYNTDEAAIRAFLAEKSAKPIVVPHRANRAVIFDSDLFHETDKIVFKDGYENRRINVTMLYGRRAYYGG
ncbi:MAG: tetratricopeptide repeat protein [Pseudomonadota bacterium]